MGWPLEPVISHNIQREGWAQRKLIREEIRVPEGVDVVVGVGGAIAG